MYFFPPTESASLNQNSDKINGPVEQNSAQNDSNKVYFTPCIPRRLFKVSTPRPESSSLMSLEMSRLKCFGFDEEADDDSINSSTVNGFDPFSPVRKPTALPPQIFLTPLSGSEQDASPRPHRFNLTLNRSNLVKNSAYVICSRKSASLEVNENALPNGGKEDANSNSKTEPKEKSGLTCIKEIPKETEEILLKSTLFSIEEDLVESEEKLVESKENLAENKIDQKLPMKEAPPKKVSCQIQPTILSFFNRENQVKSRKKAKR